MIKRLLAATIACTAILSAGATRAVDATTLRVINRGWDKCHLSFSRIPTELKDMFNSTAWDCSMHSAGVAVRFATDSRSIGVRYTLWANTHMNHQAPTGTKGVDLYILNNDNQWRHVNTGRPADQREQTATLANALDGAMHEFMVYLPLYDGVTSMDILIDDNATITNGNYDAIDAGKRVVAYGTSILQGGCASRTGMSPTAILSRRLNCEVINLAFSGGGKMEITAAQALASIPDVDAYIIDPVPNCDDAMCRDLTYDFVKTIRDAHPGVPVFMVEGPIYPYAPYHGNYATYLPEKNRLYHENYLKLLQDDPTNLYYITSENLDGPEDDGTVDGIHLTDLGFVHYADKLEPYLAAFVQGTELMAIDSHANGATDVPLAPTFTWNKPERKGQLQISTSAAFTDAAIVVRAEGTGSADVPMYTLAANRTYWARVQYTTGGSDNPNYTPAVQFTTCNAVPAVPAIKSPTDNSVLYADSRIQFEPAEGVNTIRLEVSASTSFPSRTSYINTLNAGVWQDSKTGAEIKLGSSPLVDGQTYYARIRANYLTPDGSVNTDYSDTVTFRYSASNGIEDAMSDPRDTQTDTPVYDLQGRRVLTPTPGTVNIINGEIIIR